MNDMQNLGLSSSRGNAKIVYFLFLASLVFGITAIIGIVMAYMNQQDVESWLKTHYQYQIRTFWIGILFAFIASILMFVGIGYIMYLVLVIWMIVRCVKGLKAIDAKQPVVDLKRWGF